MTKYGFQLQSRENAFIKIQVNSRNKPLQNIPLHFIIIVQYLFFGQMSCSIFFSLEDKVEFQLGMKDPSLVPVDKEILKIANLLKGYESDGCGSQQQMHKKPRIFQYNRNVNLLLKYFKVSVQMDNIRQFLLRRVVKIK